MHGGSGPIKVLIVDDSGFVRDLIREIVESEPGFLVVGEAGDGAEGARLVSELKPDIVTMDIEMPVMGGLEAIERIIAVHPVPILVVTAVTGVRTAFAAVSKGALEVVEKPDISVENARNLINKLRLLARVDMSRHLALRAGPSAAPAPAAPRRGHARGELIAVAASTGGPMAIHSILSRLPAAFPAPVVVTQHIAGGFTQGMVDWLKSATPLAVSVARHGDRLAPGHVFVNPAEYSMRVTEEGRITLGHEEAHQVFHPSCNVMLNSVAAAFRERGVGLILSGMGDDGVAGLGAIKKAGGVTLAQDAKSSVVYGMNRAAVEKGLVEKVVGLEELPAELLKRVAPPG